MPELSSLTHIHTYAHSDADDDDDYLMFAQLAILPRKKLLKGLAHVLLHVPAA